MKQLLLLTLVLFSLATCTNAPTNANILFRDQFAAGQTGAWVLEGDAIGRTSISEERLLIEVNEPGTMQFATLEDPLFTDFDLSVDARILDGDAQGSLGILFRVQDPTQFYRFEITGDGFSIVERRNADGSWTRLVDDWTETSAINRGAGVSNQLRVIAAGPTLSFYVNGILLHRVQDGQYKAGAIALDAGTFGQGSLRVVFDNVLVQPVGGG